jgi:hypothetical protein
MPDLPEPTPEWKTKPYLVWVGKLLGMDLYIDLQGQSSPKDKHKLAMISLKKAFYPPEDK